jgi:uncharacterized protein YnzC (UPF0291/DUF896 family)
MCLENILIKYGLNLKRLCNQYFDKLKEQKSEDNAEEMEALRKAYLEQLRNFQ